MPKSAMEGDMPLNKMCPYCTEPVKLVCTGCRDVGYCSEECLEADFEPHRFLCGVPVGRVTMDDPTERLHGLKEGSGLEAEREEVVAVGGQEEAKASNADEEAKGSGILDEADMNFLNETIKSLKVDSAHQSPPNGPTTADTGLERTVLYFPTITNEPILLTLPVQTDCDPVSGTVIRQQPRMQKIMKGQLYPKYHSFDRNAFTEQLLGYRIHVCHLMEDENDNEDDDDDTVSCTSASTTTSCSSEADPDPLPPNQAISTTTSNRATHPWSSPVLAFCGYPSPEHLTDQITQVTNMSLSAYSHVIAELIDYQNKSPEYIGLIGPKIEAVKVLCEGDLHAPGERGGRFRKIRLPRQHPLVSTWEAEVSPISERIGMPLVFARYGAPTPNPSADEDKVICTEADNRFVTLMQTSLLDPDAPPSPFDPPGRTTEIDDHDNDLDKELGFGFTRRYWSHNPGTVLAFHFDLLTPLEPSTLELFAYFCDDVARKCRRTHKGHDEPSSPGGGGEEKRHRVLTKEEAVAGITAEAWREFVRGASGGFV